MSDKYTIEEIDNDSHFGAYQIKKYNIYFEGNLAHTVYDTKTAEIFCWLLNENDKQKVKIDKIIKNETINDLIRLKNISKKINDAGKTESKYANLIKAIESLEADDGK